MPAYKAPLGDMLFLLRDVFNLPTTWAGTPALAELVDTDVAEAVLTEAGKLSAGLIAPLNPVADAQGCHWQEGQVSTPQGFRAAWRAYAEGGWIGLAGETAYGGAGMPKALAACVEEMLNASSLAFALYPMLTTGVCLALHAHGDKALKERFLPRLYSGEWSGTMCLTEPQAGSDLGLLATKAEPYGEGSYRITGSKIFITAGEHDLTDNIIHLVLARLPAAPAGSRGISLFLVPKRQVEKGGSLGAPNKVSCGALEHKMGIRGAATCVLNFDGATGYLVGTPHQGLPAMFTMMNYERLGVGIQGLAVGERSLQTARAYAAERYQGRAPEGTQQAEQPADPIVVHPDVQRMLLTMQALTEGGRALALHVAVLLDLARFSPDPQVQKQAAAQGALLTPVAKAFLSDRGLETTLLGQQILGGHGYICDWGQEQLVRDCRITQIYEGTNGIQAMDLLGRKVVADGGESYRCFAQEIWAFMATLVNDPLVPPLQEALECLDSLTEWLCAQASDDPRAVGAAAVEYLDMLGYVALGYFWVRMAWAARQQGGHLRAEKQRLARFYLTRILPRIKGLEACIRAGSGSVHYVPSS